jgi:hypothetical protein
MAVTGILPVVLIGEHLSGVLLIIHVTIAPVFVIALTMTALFWANFNQFDRNDFDIIKNTRDREEKNRPDYHKRIYLLKVYFWLFLTFSIPAGLSMIFSMFPLFGTDGLNMMLNIHQYTTLVLLLIAFLYTEFKLIAYNKS